MDPASAVEAALKLRESGYPNWWILPVTSIVVSLVAYAGKRWASARRIKDAEIREANKSRDDENKEVETARRSTFSEMVTELARIRAEDRSKSGDIASLERDRDRGWRILRIINNRLYEVTYLYNTLVVRLAGNVPPDFKIPETISYPVDPETLVPK